MDFTLEELRSTLVDMGLENIPDSHLELFAKDLKHLMKHEKHSQNKKKTKPDLPSIHKQPVTGPNPNRNLHTSECVLQSQTYTKKPKSVQAEATSFYPTLSHQQPKSASDQLRKANKELKPSTSANNPTRKPDPVLDKAKVDEAQWKKMKTDPVRLYGWYKTHWDFHGLNN